MEDDSRPVLVPTVATRMESTTVGWRGNRRGDDGETLNAVLFIHLFNIAQYRAPFVCQCVAPPGPTRCHGSVEGGVNLVWNTRKIAAVCWVWTTIIGRDTL
jgi:hypothetical protein